MSYPRYHDDLKTCTRCRRIKSVKAFPFGGSTCNTCQTRVNPQSTPVKKTPKQKRRARQRLSRAVARGKIHKPTICESCGGEFPKDYIDAHHTDYSKPLKVQWVCKPCHRGIHRGQ